jgi:hypothetical protein
MVEVEDAEVGLAAVDARMLEEERADALEVLRPRTRDLLGHCPSMLLEVLGVVAP